MIAANYFDGRSPRLRPVQLSATEGAVLVSGDDITVAYPACGVTLAEPLAQAPAMLYFGDGAHCEVAGESRAALAAALGYQPSRVVRWQARWRVALFALVLLAALIAAAAVWGVPAAAEHIAAAVPASIDKKLGQATLAQLESRGVLRPSRLSDERIAEVQQVLRQVLPARTRMPLRLLVRHAPALGANAFALPDGTIVVTDLMVRRILARETEFGPVPTARLAGVLAHEIGHIEARHSIRLLARSSLTAALSASLFGDFSAVAAGVPAVLTNLHHSREMETDADTYAIVTLRQRGIALEPLADFFAALGEHVEEDGDDPAGWSDIFSSYVESHPKLSERSARLRKGAR